MSGKHLLALFIDARFLSVVGCGSVVIILSTLLASQPVQLGLIGFFVLLLLALFLTQPRHESALAEPLETALALARDEKVSELHRLANQSLLNIAENTDSLYRDLALQRSTELLGELSAVGKKRIVYLGTETWRMAYAKLLRSPGLHLYRSIAFVKTSNYWQTEPGRQSMQLNFDMVKKGTLNIERIAIVPDHLWPAGERFPSHPLREWIDEQHNHGIWFRLVRQSELADDPDLVVDLGIYGNRAVGFHELDGNSRTVRFTLSFDFAEVLAAEDRWERLTVYSTSYRELLDRSARDS